MVSGKCSSESRMVECMVKTILERILMQGLYSEKDLNVRHLRYLGARAVPTTDSFSLETSTA